MMHLSRTKFAEFHVVKLGDCLSAEHRPGPSGDT